MKKTAKILAFALAMLMLCPILAACNGGEHTNLVNNFVEYPMPQAIDEGIVWEDGQALPRFSTPVKVMKAIKTANLTLDERITISSFQGLVNKHKTEILMLQGHDSGISDIWQTTEGIDQEYVDKTESRYQLINDFSHRIGGVVLYDTTRSINYRNVATTIGGLMGYLPVTQDVLAELQSAGFECDPSKAIDITDWTESDAFDIYTRLYNEYWQQCSKRVLMLSNPSYDVDRCRDIAVAVGAAVIFLDTDNSAREQELYRQFMKDMRDNGETAITVGWGISERSPIVISSEFGIGLVPADHYISATVYSGTNPQIQIPTVPRRDKAENKAYVAMYLSDGDNIQYVQGAMRLFWDRNAEYHGITPVTWTISPALADIGAGLMNYYYSQATDMECFASGPSGMGYLLATNTGDDDYNGVHLTQKEYADAYTQLTAQYLQRTGIKVITIWDDAEPVVRKSYAENCRSLIGATVHQFGSRPVVKPSVENDRLNFDLLDICYHGSIDRFENEASLQIGVWRLKAQKPLFLSYQLVVWESQTKIAVGFEKYLKNKFGDSVQFVRADHYFSLYNEVNGLPFDITNLKDVELTSSGGEDTTTLLDGSPTTVWEGGGGKKSTVLTYDLKDAYNISRYVMHHAELAYLSSQNNKSWVAEYSADGKKWHKMDDYRDNTAAGTDVDLPEAVNARYVRFTFPSSEKVVLGGIEIYGKKI